MKWIIIGLSLIAIIAMIAGYTGGASKAGTNYYKVMRQ